VQNAKLWQKLLGVERTVVEKVVFDEEAGVVVASVPPIPRFCRQAMPAPEPSLPEELIDATGPRDEPNA